MCDRRWAAAAVLLLVSLTGRLSTQERAPWHDSSPAPKRLLFHGASPLAVLYPEKLSFVWTKFREAGQGYAEVC